MLKRVSNRDLLELVKGGKAEYDSGEAKKVFDPEEAHAKMMRTLEIIATHLQETNGNEEIIDLHRALRVSLDNLFSSMMSKFSEVLMEVKREPVNYMPILESINQKSSVKSNEEWEFDASRDSTGKIIFPIKARRL